MPTITKEIRVRASVPIVIAVVRQPANAVTSL